MHSVIQQNFKNDCTTYSHACLVITDNDSIQEYSIPCTCISTHSDRIIIEFESYDVSLRVSWPDVLNLCDCEYSYDRDAHWGYSILFT